MCVFVCGVCVCVHVSQYTITEHGQVAGVANMMAEMYQRGPIACGMAVTSEFVAYKGGIFNDTTGHKVRGGGREAKAH